MTHLLSGKDIYRSFKKNDMFSAEYGDCQTCGKATHLVHINGKLYYDPICECTGPAPVTHVPWDKLAEDINKMRSQKKKAVLLKRLKINDGEKQ